MFVQTIYEVLLTQREIKMETGSLRMDCGRDKTHSPIS